MRGSSRNETTPISSLPKATPKKEEVKGEPLRFVIEVYPDGNYDIIEPTPDCSIGIENLLYGVCSNIISYLDAQRAVAILALSEREHAAQQEGL